MRKCANISPYVRRPLVIYDFATAPFWISLYMRKIWLSFLSVCSLSFGLSKRPSNKKKEKKMRKFYFSLARFPPKPFSSRGKSGAYQFICEVRHVAEPRNHGNHSWLVPTARTKPSLFFSPYFLLSSVCGFLKGLSHAHFVFYLKASKLILRSKKVFLNKFFTIGIINRIE